MVQDFKVYVKPDCDIEVLPNILAAKKDSLIYKTMACICNKKVTSKVYN